NPAVTKEHVASADAALVLGSIWDDTRYALRQLRKSPGFAATTVLTLAVGIGANLAIFQLLYGVLFAQLPVKQPAELYSLHAVQSPFDGEWFFSFPAYQRLRQATHQDAAVFARSGFGVGVLQETDGATSRIDFQLVSDNFFSVLGLSPSAGRFFLEGDDQREQSEWPVILRYGYFKEHFGGSQPILGRRATFNGVPIVIVGVAPKGFSGVVRGQAADLWLPLAAQATDRFGTWFDSLGPGYDVHLSRSYRNQASIFWLWVLSRTPDGVKPAAAAHWTQVLAPDLSLMASAAKDTRDRRRILGSQVKLVSAANGEGSLARTYSLPLFILMAMAFVILLVGCLNLANLQLARLMEREIEIATRIALGASRARVLRQVAIEAVVLAAIGGVLAFATGQGASALLLHWASGRGQTIPIDPQIGTAATLLGTALLLGALVGFGLLPAWQMTRKSFAMASKTRVGQLSTQSKAGRRWSNLLLASQVSFSLLLLCAAGLFAQTLRNLSRVDAGMDRDHVLSIHLDMRSTGFAKQQNDLPSFYDTVIQQLKTLPMVRDAAVHMCRIPNCVWNTALHVFGRPEMAESQLHGKEDHVGVSYFRTLGMPLLRGRDFSKEDNQRSQLVAILSRSYARKLFGDESPLGHWIGYSVPPGDHQFLVVGEVADARVDGLRSNAPPVAYLPIDQSPAPVQSIEVRVRGSLATLPAEIRNSLYKIAPALPVTEIVPLDLEFDDGLSTEALLARLTSIFGALTLALAALGFYGLLTFRVARRTSEIGIRMALGATGSQVRALFLGQTLQILIAGLIPGAALALGTSYLARKLLYGTGRMDIWALGFAAVVLAAAGLLATLVPAHQAASIDPMRALRSE
ncbi:MAG TPA: ADOP family duplicated permease, partial [Acidobacteriaceae bacterium]|nr:ADOP family duplicated permease [Acidobacteriaceae bacterium]